jgi:hypothetical protein
MGSLLRLSRCCPPRVAAEAVSKRRDRGSRATTQRKEVVEEMSSYAASTRSRPGFSLLFVVYVAIGAVVAYTHHYWSHLHTAKAILSAVLATLLWPLLLLGINLHIH